MVFRKDRSVSRGGGLAVYVNSTIRCKSLSQFANPGNVSECLWLQLRPRRLPRSVSSVLLAVIYRPPYATAQDNNDLYNHVKAAVNLCWLEHPECLICVVGDFNPNSTNISMAPFKRMCGLTQIVKVFTREKFLRRVQLKAFFHDKEDDSNTSNKDTFETLQIRKSKWTPPEGQFSSLDFFLKKCRHDINKLKFNRNTKFSNLSSEEWLALKSLKKRKDIVIKAADKGGAVVVWRADLYQKEALRQLSDTSFYAKVDKDLTLINQNTVKNTINDLIAKQELPATAKNLIITTPRTSCIYFLPKIHKPNNPGRPIVSACSCPTELISSYLDKIMAPIVKTLPSYIKDSQHALEIFRDFNFLDQNKLIFTMDITSLYTVIPNDEGLRALKHFFDQRTVKEPSSETLLRLAELVLTLNCFSFGGNYYKQTNGVAMGTKMGPSYANLFVGFIEHQFFSQYHGPKPQLYGRYIDDCIGATSSTKEELT